MTVESDKVPGSTPISQAHPIQTPPTPLLPDPRYKVKIDWDFSPDPVVGDMFIFEVHQIITFTGTSEPPTVHVRPRKVVYRPGNIELQPRSDTT